MVYPLVKRFIEKSVSSSKGNSRPGLGDSQGYRLESYKNKSASRPRPDERDLGDTVWGSKEHIVATEIIDKGQSSGDDASLPGSDKAPNSYNTRMRATPTPGAIGGNSSAVASFGGAKNWRHGAKAGDQIIVTNEYTVRVDEEAASGTPGRYAGR